MREFCIFYYYALFILNGRFGILCNLQSIGCLEKNYNGLDHYFSEFVSSEDICLEHCISYNYLYAVVEPKGACFCSSLAQLPIKSCIINCTIFKGTCAENLTLLVYNITEKVPGVVNNIKLNYSNENSLRITWEPPIIKNGVITNYKISLSLNQSFAQGLKFKSINDKMENIYDANILQAQFRGLSPSSSYLLKVQAGNKFGYGTVCIRYAWTANEMPYIIPNFIIIENDTMEIEFPLNKIGLISAYRIVLCKKVDDNPSYLGINESKQFLATMENKSKVQSGTNDVIDMDNHMLSPITYATPRVPSNLKDCHIIAQLNSSFGKVNNEIRYFSFIVGDNKSYGGFLNRKPTYLLSKDNIYMGVVSDLSQYLKNSQDLYVPETKIFYSFQQYLTSNSLDFLGQAPVGSNGTYYNALVNTVATLISITIILLLLYVGMRWFYHKRTLASKHAYTNEFSSTNGLSKDIQLSLIEGNGGKNVDDNLLQIIKTCDGSTNIDALIQTLVPSELIYHSQNFYFDALKRMFGMGRFGKVYKGKTRLASGQTLVTALLTIPINAFTHSENELLELGKALKIAVATRAHPNFPKFFGLSHGSAADELWVALEVPNAHCNLRDDILRRKMRDSMKNGISNIIKNLMLIALGVANGLRRLEELNIFHPKLAAKNVWVEEGEPKGCVAKIGCLGFNDYSCHDHQEPGELGEFKDLTSISQRWQAPEYVFGRSYTFKSTIWSLGILLWEILTLGATPYADHRTADAVKKIRLANLRPSRPFICAGDNDEVYQLLLDCWLLQPEERPNMASIISNLESFALNPKIYFVNTPPSYLEPFDVETENT